MNAEHITVIEAAERLAKRPETIRRWITAGRLASVRDGARVMVPLAALASIKDRTCARCGAPYTPERPTRPSRYCSGTCRWADASAKRKATHPASRPPGRPRKPATTAGVGGVVPERLRAALRLVRGGHPAS